MAYELTEPWGERVMDWRFARLMAMVFNRTSWGKEAPSKPEDHMPDFTGERRKRRRKMTVAECKASGAALNAKGG